jgi:hypothetical protein
MSFLQTLKNVKGGTAQLNLAGSAAQAMPVFVTNWGGAGSAAPFTGTQSVGAGGLLDQHGNPIGKQAPQNAPPAKTPPNAKGKKWNLKPNRSRAVKAGAGAAGFAAVTAAFAVPVMVDELRNISKNEELTKAEKSTARGGAIGDMVGSVGGALGGAAAGALAGAALGSIVPGVGTAIGLVAGGLIGQFGGPLGRLIGEKIGAAVGKETEDKTAAAQAIPAANVPPAITGYAPYAPGQQAMRFDGKVGLQTDLYIHRDGSFTATQKTRNDSNFPYETGSAFYARGTN